MAGDVDSGPNVTAIKSTSGSTYLRCTVHFTSVLRTNANVTWHKADGKPMSLVRVNAMAAITKSPDCSTTTNLRRTKRSSGKYKCRVMWDPPKAFLPQPVYEEFLVISVTKRPATLELCITTDTCGKGESHTRVSFQMHGLIRPCETLHTCTSAAAARSIMFSGRPSGHPFTSISRDAISLYSIVNADLLLLYEVR